MKWQFELWRLFVGVTCIATALGLLRFAWITVQTYGDGWLLVGSAVAALALFVAGIGVIFRRAREALLWLLVLILNLLRFF